jgi:hypothetical protein
MIWHQRVADPPLRVILHSIAARIRPVLALPLAQGINRPVRVKEIKFTHFLPETGNDGAGRKRRVNESYKHYNLLIGLLSIGCPLLNQFSTGNPTHPAPQ